MTKLMSLLVRRQKSTFQRHATAVCISDKKEKSWRRMIFNKFLFIFLVGCLLIQLIRSQNFSYRDNKEKSKIKTSYKTIYDYLKGNI